MSQLKKSFAAGYTKSSVEGVCRSLKRRNDYLQVQLEQNTIEIEKLEKELVYYRQRQQHLTTVMEDIKKLSGTMIEQAQKQAIAIKENADVKFGVQEQDYSEKLEQLESLREQVSQQAVRLQQEFKRFLAQSYTFLDEKSHAFEEVKEEIGSNFNLVSSLMGSINVKAIETKQTPVQEEPQKERKVIVLPKFDAQDKKNDVPVFSY